MPKRTIRIGDICFQVGKNKKNNPESWCCCNFISMAGIKRTDSSAAMMTRTQAAGFPLSAANRNSETEF